MTSDPSDARPASDDSFRRLVEGAPDGVVISRDGVVLYVNTAALRLLGYDHPADLVGRSMATFLDAEAIGRMRQRLQEMATTGVKPSPAEYPARRRDGTAVTAEISSIFFEFEGAPAVLAFARDVTERVRLRAQLEQANRLAALGLMAGGVAHEINNPLAFVSLAAELLERRLGASGVTDEVRALVGDVRTGVSRIAAIARDLRMHGRYEEEPAGAVSLAEVLDSAERIVAHALRTRVHVRREGPETLPAVLGVATRLEQVFVNLLLNAGHAIDAQRRDGEIVVRVDVRPADVVIAVEDNGSGIAPELLPRIFEPFYTTRPPAAGTGLGLSISRDIVARVGGTITATSEPGRGTTMRVTLVRATAEASVVASPSKGGTTIERAPRRRILVIDDEPLVVSMLVRILGERHDVVGEVTAQAGLDRLVADPSFDLVLCDLMMPELTGMDVHAHVARERPGLERKIVFITGGSFTHQVRAFLEEVPNGRLMKPLSSRDLEPFLIAPP